MAAPLSERVVATEIEIKALNKKVTDLEGEIKTLNDEVKKLLNTHHWAIGAVAGAVFVLTIFADYIKKHLGL